MASGSGSTLPCGVASFAPVFGTTLNILKRARRILAEHYVKWTVNDYRGGHCASGALRMAERGHTGICGRTPAFFLLEEAARRLHPELAGCERWRDDRILDTDRFDDFPFIFVNNHLGKEAILAVFDDAILHEEMRLMLEAIPEKALPEPEPDPQPA